MVSLEGFVIYSRLQHISVSSDAVGVTARRNSGNAQILVPLSGRVYAGIHFEEFLVLGTVGR